MESQELLIDKTSLNWFKPVCVQLSDVIDQQKWGGHTKYKLTLIICIFTFKYYLVQNPTTQSFQTIYVMIFNVDAHMYEIFVDF